MRQARTRHAMRRIDQRLAGSGVTLTRAEETELGERMAHGDWTARDQLIEANIRLVVAIASRHTDRGVDLDDLVSEGILGLMRASETWSPDRSKFSTYAGHWVDAVISKYVDLHGQPVRIPKNAAELTAKWLKVEGELADRLGRFPTAEEVAEASGFPEKKVAIVRKALDARGSGSDDDESPVYTIADPHTVDPSEVVIAAEEWALLWTEISRLDLRESVVLGMHLRADSGQPLFKAEIGRRLGISPDAVADAENRAVEKLKATLGRTYAVA